MKTKLNKSIYISFILILISILFITLLALTGCTTTKDEGNNNNNITPPPSPPPTISYLSKENLYFASSCDMIKLEKYFKENGTQGGNFYQISKNSPFVAYAVRYFPENKEFYITAGSQSSTYLPATEIAYQYTYITSIKVCHNQNLMNAKYIGDYTYESASNYSSNYGYYEASFSFNSVKFLSLTEVSDFSIYNFTGQITQATNWSKAQEHFDKYKVAETIYDRINGCLNFINNLFQEIDTTYKLADKNSSPSSCAHSAVIDKGYDATCTSEGLSDGTHCSKCSTILEPQTKIPTIAHNPQTIKGTPATCNTAGLTDGSYCLSCEQTIKEQEVIKAHHTFVDGKCSTCNRLEPSKGLQIEKTGQNEYYSVVGIGECTDETIIIPDIYNGLPVKTIDDYAFKDTLITEIFISKNIVDIDIYAFANCSNLKNVIFEEQIQLRQISTYAFSNCSSLKSIVVPKSVKFLSNAAFRNCSTLTIYCEANSLPNEWDDNWNFSQCPVYWYSETKPTSGNFWHHDTDGKTPAVWEIS